MAQNAQSLVKKYNDSITKKEVLQADKQELLADILIKEDQGKDPEKLRAALRALMLKIEIAEKRIEKCKANFKADISRHVDSQLAALDKDLRELEIKFSDQLKQAGTNLGIAQKLFQSLGPLFSTPIQEISEIVNGIKADNSHIYREIDYSDFLEAFSQAKNDTEIFNIHISRQELSNLKRVKLTPSDRRSYEEKLFYRALRGSFY